jgi:hypothetical protein
MSVIQGEDFDESSDIDEHEVGRNVDFLNNRGRAVVGPLYIENGEDFIFSYYDKAWLHTFPSLSDLRKYLASFPSIQTLLFLTTKSQTIHKNSTCCCLKEIQKLLSLIWWKSARVLLKRNTKTAKPNLVEICPCIVENQRRVNYPFHMNLLGLIFYFFYGGLINVVEKQIRIILFYFLENLPLDIFNGVFGLIKGLILSLN